MQLQVSPLSPSFANVSRVQQESSSSSNSMALDSPTLNIRNNKAVRFAGDGNGLMENRLVSAIETLTTLSRKQNDVLTYSEAVSNNQSFYKLMHRAVSKLEEDQLTLTHERVRGERTASILSARVSQFASAVQYSFGS